MTMRRVRRLAAHPVSTPINTRVISYSFPNVPKVPKVPKYAEICSAIRFGACKRSPFAATAQFNQNISQFACDGVLKTQLERLELVADQ
jgi:hypothetical protein